MLIKQFFTAVVMNKTGFALFTFVFGWVLLNIWAPDQIGETNLNWQSGTEFVGTMRHENTEDRVWEFPRAQLELNSMGEIIGAGTIVLEDNEATFTNKSLSNFRFNDPEINNMRLDQIIITDLEPLPINSGGFGVTDLIGFFDIQNFTGSLEARHITNQAIQTDAISNNAIGTAKILDNEIQTGDLGPDVVVVVDDGSITSEFIADGEVIGVKLANSIITTDLLADNSINEARIQVSSVQRTDFTPDVFGTAQFENNSINISKIDSNAIFERHIPDNTITSSKIQDSSIEISDISFVPEPRDFYDITLGSITHGGIVIFPEPIRVTRMEICLFNIGNRTQLRVVIGPRIGFNIINDRTVYNSFVDEHTQCFGFNVNWNVPETDMIYFVGNSLRIYSLHIEVTDIP